MKRLILIPLLALLALPAAAQTAPPLFDWVTWLDGLALLTVTLVIGAVRIWWDSLPEVIVTFSPFLLAAALDALGGIDSGSVAVTFLVGFLTLLIGQLVAEPTIRAFSDGLPSLAAARRRR